MVRRSPRNKNRAQDCAVQLSKTRDGVSEDLAAKKNISALDKDVNKAKSIKTPARKTKNAKGLNKQSSPHVRNTHRAPLDSRAGGSSLIDLSDMMVKPEDLKLSIGPSTPFLCPKLVQAAETFTLNRSPGDLALFNFAEDPSRRNKLSAATVSVQSSLGSVSTLAM